MAKIKPFRAWRPRKDMADKTASLPYDVYQRKEAYAQALKAPLSFLNIDRPETQFPPEIDMYSDEVYAKAKEMLDEEKAKEIYIQDKVPCYYLYELTMNGRSQTGLVACASVDDYINNVIKKHENTREEKEKDRIRHVDVCSMQTGPIFLAYHGQKKVDDIVAQIRQTLPVYDFVTEDHIRHRCFVIDDAAQVEMLTKYFDEISSLYIADGHHRAASAVKVGLKRRRLHPKYKGDEEFNSFLSVIFPDNQLEILPYYRVVKDLNGNTAETFLKKVSKCFIVEKAENPVSPVDAYTYGCFLDGQWYSFKLKTEYVPSGLVESLDVSVLQNMLLEPVLGIKDPKTDARIDFVGGIHGVSMLEKRCHEDMAVAFSLRATGIDQLFAVADAGLLMPPKSTWFEPKLRSGLFFHEIEP